MPMRKLFSQQKKTSEKSVDVFQYDVLPDGFRNQVIHILASTLGTYQDWPLNAHLSEPSVNRRWKTLFSLYTCLTSIK